MTEILSPESFIPCRSDWSVAEIDAILASPFIPLVHTARTVHMAHFPEDAVQLATLLSIKTGGCPEDCAYCPQSVHHAAEVANHKLMDPDAVIEAAVRAKQSGATRFCMGAAWRSPRDQDVARVADVIRAVKALGLETCVTLGMLEPAQAATLADAGLDYYNHNLDTSPEFYPQIITTRTYESRLETLRHVRGAGIKVCCGGIVGLGEQVSDRVGLLHQLATMDPHPESVPVNMLVPVEGTPLSGAQKIPVIDLVRVIATARLIMPASTIRLSAGRTGLSESDHALCFMAGANSVFYGDALLTTPNPSDEVDRGLLHSLGLKAAT